MQPSGRRGLLAAVTPTAFEAWVGDRFRALGYDVDLTPRQGDHGADLLARRGGELVVVQCKHHPKSTVGEPVLRDLYGAMHHFGATSAVLVTTGRVTPAARAWLVGKPIEVWDADVLRDRWASEIAEATRDAEAATPAVAPSGSRGGRRGASERGGWYVYTERAFDGLRRYAVRVPASVGEHPRLGFTPLDDPSLPIAPASIYLRTITFTKVGDHRQSRTVPVGTEEALTALRGKPDVEFPQRDGTTAVWRFHRAGQESSRAAAQRAKETGGAPRLRGEARLREIQEQIERAERWRRERAATRDAAGSS